MGTVPAMLKNSGGPPESARYTGAMTSIAVLVALLLLVAVGAWLIWRPGGLAIPTRLRDEPPAYDLATLLPPYRERFGALLKRQTAADTPAHQALLRRAYELANEGSSLSVHMQAGARTAEMPVQDMDAWQNQYHEMRERREHINAELAAIEAKYGL